MREVNESGERTMRKGSRREGGKRKVNCRDKHKEKVGKGRKACGRLMIEGKHEENDGEGRDARES